MAAVIAITHVGGPDATRVAKALADGHDVSQTLTWMMGVGEGVDHRHVCVLGQLHHLAVVHRADDDGVNESREHLGGVLDRLAAPKLHVPAGQHHRVRPQTRDAHLKRHTRSRGGLLEDHGDAFPGKRCRPLRCGLQLVGQIEYVPDRIGGVMHEREH